MSDKVVTVYSTPTCSYCKMVKKFLNDNEIAYTEIDVAGDKKALEEMIKKSGQISVPTIEIDGEFIIGFDQQSLKQKLGLE